MLVEWLSEQIVHFTLGTIFTCYFILDMVPLKLPIISRLQNLTNRMCIVKP